jgi:hypothetical protein
VAAASRVSREANRAEIREVIEILRSAQDDIALRCSLGHCERAGLIYSSVTSTSADKVAWCPLFSTSPGKLKLESLMKYAVPALVVGLGLVLASTLWAIASYEGTSDQTSECVCADCNGESCTCEDCQCNDCGCGTKAAAKVDCQQGACCESHNVVATTACQSDGSQYKTCDDSACTREVCQ